MSKDHSERRTYRRSPGRQYGYEYDPLRSRTEQNQSGRIDSDGLRDPATTRGETPSKSGSLASQRPDLRRTRQLLRQNILATKARLVEDGDEQEELQEIEQPEEHIPEYPLYDEEEDTTLYHKRYPTRSGRLVQARPASEQELVEAQEDTWEDIGDVDPDIGYEEIDPLDADLEYIREEPRYASNRPLRVRQVRPRHSIRPVETEGDYYDDEYEDYEEEVRRPPARRKNKKRKISRRGLLAGAAVAAIGGASITAYELAPKLPQVVGTAAHNVEQQVQEAFQRGMAQGADNVRKEFITSLENLEGFTLNGAIAAAKLTRVAYDVFVSPIVQFGSTLTGDFLNGMLKAVKTARGWLAQVYMDNSAMIAIQKVLEAWVGKVGSMPKQLNAIADTDLDGAQSYLNALQNKIAQEKAKLNNPQTAPTTPPVKK
ncbi:MAG: hypothetical protein JO215_03325 [Ktedonobacteraceae bacterium]|nr:hypothetical protein [Ktedonobacteraceae bacterium]